MPTHERMLYFLPCRAYRVTLRADEKEKLGRLLRAPVACRGRREGNAGPDCIADVSACPREALRVAIQIDFKISNFGYSPVNPWAATITLPKYLGPEMVQTPLNRRQ